LVVASFGLRNANLFWKRFEFRSRLYWIECNGNYTSATMQVGSEKNDRVISKLELVNVESMTLRVWVAELDSVAFDTNWVREMVSLRGLPQEAERLCRQLASFGVSQASVIAPTSSVDRERLAYLNSINLRQLHGTQPITGQARPPLADANSFTGAPSEPARPNYCPSCGTPVTGDESASCGACGKPLM
jgi:hypothetical protein